MIGRVHVLLHRSSSSSFDHPSIQGTEPQSTSLNGTSDASEHAARRAMADRRDACVAGLSCSRSARARRAGDPVAAVQERRARSRTARPTTTPPSRSTSSILARAVPPVARTSSSTITRAPGAIASACTSSASVPYSSVVARLDRLPRQLAGLAGRHEAAAERVRERAAEDEAAGLGAEDHVGRARAGPGGEPVDRLAERHRVARSAASRP